MLRVLKCISVTLLLLALSACGPIYKTEYKYIPPHSNMAKMCTAQCIQSKNTCEQMCQMRQDNCKRDARQDGYYRYEMYKRERLRQGQSVDRSVNYFVNDFACQESCQCGPTFNACYAACGGEVLERKVCVAFCDKK